MEQKCQTKRQIKSTHIGHGRIEYLTAIVISEIILYAGIIAAKESILKILSPIKAEYSLIFLVIIAATVLTKFFLSKHVKKMGENANSQSLIASGQDAFMDAILSFTTLIAAVVNYIFGLNLEGYLGVIISIIILKSAIEILKKTIDSLLGSRADKELALNLKEIVNSFDEVQGAYDLNLHNYGPSKTVASIHIQVRNDMTAEEIHILTREIEYLVYSKLGIALTIGIYAANDKGEFGDIKEKIQNIIKEYKSVLQLHGFYVDKAKNNVYFDLIMDFEEEHKEQIRDEILEKIKSEYMEYNFNVILDSDVTD